MFSHPITPTIAETAVDSTAPSSVVHTTGSETSENSGAFHAIEIIFFGIKDDIGSLLTELQDYALKRDDVPSKNFSMEVHIKFHLEQQVDLAGCRDFIRRYGKTLEATARRIFAEYAAQWDDDDLEDAADEIEPAAQQQDEDQHAVAHEDARISHHDATEQVEAASGQQDGDDYVVSDEVATRVQQMLAYEALQVAQRLGTLQDLILRDVSLLSEEDLAHRPTCTWAESHTAHWTEVLSAYLKGESDW